MMRAGMGAFALVRVAFMRGRLARLAHVGRRRGVMLFVFLGLRDRRRGEA
jgi:hypothetical protein